MSVSESGNSTWLDLPAEVRTSVARELGSPVVEFALAGPAKEGVVGVVTTVDTRAFIKSVPSGSAAANDFRTEAAVSQALPTAVPTPRLRFMVEDRGWVVLCLDALSGRHPSEPWRPNELLSVLDALDDCDAALSSFDTSGLPTVADRMRGRCRTWGALAEVGTFERLTVRDLSPWERRHLDRLAEVETNWHTCVAGRDLLHFDLRFDNIMLVPSGSVWFLDWGRASVGPRWVDLVCLFLESELGSIDPEEAFLARCTGADADPDAVDAFLVALASNWKRSATQPPPLHDPGLRARRVCSRDQTLAWLARRWA